MDWLYVFMPIVGVKVFWPGLVILGLGVGIIGGFFGMGGAWMVTPGLNILGFPMAFAIGTDIAHMSGKSLISTMRHAKFGNVDYKLGSMMVLGTVCGVECGSRIVMWLERMGSVALYVRYGYMILLTVIAWVVFSDVRQKQKKDQEARAAGRSVEALSTGLEWHKKLQQLNIPPIVYFPKSGVRCSAWLPITIALFTGLLAGFLGIGGGLICMPALIYLVGCPTHVAVGTDLFGVMISGLYGAATYSYKGRVDLVAVFIMLVGAAVGAQIGTVATKYVKGYAIRVYFGLAVVGCGISVLLKLLGAAYLSLKPALDLAATILILSLVTALSLFILLNFLKGVAEERRARKETYAHV
jgi:uncharacterized membrane protein YfcA